MAMKESETVLSPEDAIADHKEYATEFQCQICHNIAELLTICNQCENSYCAKCIEMCPGKKCPTC